MLPSRIFRAKISTYHNTELTSSSPYLSNYYNTLNKREIYFYAGKIPSPFDLKDHEKVAGDECAKLGCKDKICPKLCEGEKVWRTRVYGNLTSSKYVEQKQKEAVLLNKDRNYSKNKKIKAQYFFLFPEQSEIKKEDTEDINNSHIFNYNHNNNEQ